MTVARIPTLAIVLFLTLPACAQAPAKPLAARVAALEKENAALREDVDRLEKLLIQTRRDMLTVQAGRIGGGAYVAPPMPGAVMADSVTAIVTYPVSVWFDGRRNFDAVLSFGGRAIEKITLDPFGRFPDRDVTDNVWPRAAKP